MTRALIRAALEKRLNLMTPAIGTAWQNIGYTEVANVPYQRVAMLWSPPDSSMKGPNIHIERGLFQVTLSYPEGTGAGAAEARAGAIVNWFQKGRSIVEGAVTVQIIKPPEQSGQLPATRYEIAVTIPFQAQILVPAMA